MTRQRLQKLIAAAGLCSRRRAEEWLQAGRVTVDGQVARVGDLADPQQQTIHVDGQPLPSRGVARVLLINKPVGVICSCDDPQGRRTVLDLQRTAIAGLPLGDLAEGCWIWLSEGEWKPLLERAGSMDLPNSPCD